ncbi:hypothetical protein [Anabaena subtropica]|uniref:Uncharacterized protein n=1 Tax=Anabaena subtropica FACHB-260 TaxID=2692884 RepID=A0ABR8CX49_9NOST|nr:hypothetical protein [Anabaena subtropica]MBD2346365.1 hypothetical protein [Anabaena subtropica FACHB-260]
MVRVPCRFQSYSPLYLVLNLAESICGYKLCIFLTHLKIYNNSAGCDGVPHTVGDELRPTVGDRCLTLMK